MKIEEVGKSSSQERDCQSWYLLGLSYDGRWMVHNAKCVKEEVNETLKREHNKESPDVDVVYLSEVRTSVDRSQTA